MKRSALILLTAIYLLSCVGMGINRFFCCGKLLSVTLIYGAADNAVNKPGKKDNCCKNEQQSLKVKDSHFNTTALSLNHPLPVLIQSFTHLDNLDTVKLLQTKIAYHGNAPPGHPDIPVYALNCAYRI
ncbi:MAG: HYC_CC_PP family protein [Mucilaginibacter sp.]